MSQITETTIIKRLGFPAMIVDKFTLKVIESNHFFNNVENCSVPEMIRQDGHYIFDGDILLKLIQDITTDSDFINASAKVLSEKHTGFFYSLPTS